MATMQHSDRVEAVTAQGVRLSLTCANPDCGKRLLTLHCSGSAVIDVLECPKCHRTSQYVWTATGVEIRLLKPAPRQRAA